MYKGIEQCCIQQCKNRHEQGLESHWNGQDRYGHRRHGHRCAALFKRHVQLLYGEQHPVAEQEKPDHQHYHACQGKQAQATEVQNIIKIEPQVAVQHQFPHDFHTKWNAKHR